MALQKQVLDVSFGQGLSEKIDRKILPNGVLTKAENVAFRKASTLDRRYGYQGVSLDGLNCVGGTAAVAQPLRMLSANGQPLLIGDGSAPSTVGAPDTVGAPTLMQRTHAGKWRQFGLVSDCSISRTPITYARPVHVGAQFASAVTSGEAYGVTAWVGKGGIYAIVMGKNGEIIIDEQKLSTATALAVVRLVSHGALVYAYYCLAGGGVGDLKCRVFNSATLTWGPEGEITNIQPEYTCQFDVADSGTDLVIVWQPHAAIAAQPISLSRVTYVAPVTVTVSIPLRSGAYFGSCKADRVPLSISINSTTHMALVGFVGDNGNTPRVEQIQVASVQLSPTFVMEQQDHWPAAGAIDVTDYVTGVYSVPLSDGRFFVVWDAGHAPGANGNPPYVIAELFDTSLLFLGSPIGAWNVRMASRPVAITDRSKPPTSEHVVYLFLHFEGEDNQASRLQRTYFLSRWETYGNTIPKPPQCSAIVAPRQASAPACVGTHPTPTYALNQLVVPLGMGTQSQPTTNSGDDHWAQGVDAVVATLDTSPLWLSTQVGLQCTVGGGWVGRFDGKCVSELGFFVWPEICLTSPNNPSLQAVAFGPNVEHADYWYRVLFEYIDVQGNIERSAPSLACKISDTAFSGNDQQVTLNVYVPPFSGKTTWDASTAPHYTRNGLIRVSLWRTTTTDQINYHRVDQLDTVATAYVDPQSTTGLVTLVDTGAYDNTAVATHEMIYTTGAPGQALENVCPPSATISCLHDGRLWLAGTEQPQTVWFSKTLLSGEAPGFNEGFTITLLEGGAVTGIASLGDKLVIFKRSSTWIIYGQGPADNGTSNGYQDPICISKSIGCVDPRSVLSAADGVYFQGVRGLYRVTQTLAIEFVGAAVEDELLDYPVVTSAVCVDSQQQLRWTCSTVAGDAAEIVAFDYVMGQWCTARTFDIGVVGVPIYAGNMTSATLVGDVYWILDSGNQTICYEAAGTYKDVEANATVSQYRRVIETGDVHLAGLQGYQRAWTVSAMGDYVAAHGFEIKVFYDYSEIEADAESFVYSEADVSATIDERFCVRLLGQRCSALRVRLTDSPAAASSGASCTMDAIAIEYGVIGGTKRLPAAARK